MLHHLLVDFYVGPAVLLLSREAIGVTAFIDEAREQGMYTWCGFLDLRTYNVDLRFQVIEEDQPMLTLPGGVPCGIDVVYTSGQGIGFVGNGTSPLGAQQDY